MQSELLIAYTVSSNMSLTATHIHISATNFTWTTRGLYRLPSTIIAHMKPPHNANAWQEQRLPNAVVAAGCGCGCCGCWHRKPRIQLAGKAKTWWENTKPKHYPPSLKLVLLPMVHLPGHPLHIKAGRGGILAPVIDCSINQRWDPSLNFNWGPLCEPKHSHSNACDTALGQIANQRQLLRKKIVQNVWNLLATWVASSYMFPKLQTHDMDRENMCIICILQALSKFFRYWIYSNFQHILAYLDIICNMVKLASKKVQGRSSTIPATIPMAFQKDPKTWDRLDLLNNSTCVDKVCWKLWDLLGSEFRIHGLMDWFVNTWMNIIHLCLDV